MSIPLSELNKIVKIVNLHDFVGLSEWHERTILLDPEPLIPKTLIKKNLTKTQEKTQT